MRNHPLLMGILIGVGSVLIVGATFAIGLGFGRAFSGVSTANQSAPGMQRHGLTGTVIQVVPNQNQFTILTRAQEQQDVTVVPTTVFRQGKLPSTFASLSEGDAVVIVGVPQDDQYIARTVVIQPIPAPAKPKKP